jgi:hypothetical protein
VFPIMPLTALFFILLIYRALGIWRSRNVAPSPVFNQ